MGLSNGLKEEHEAPFFTKIYLCKKAGFLHKKAAFLQKYLFVKKAAFLLCKNNHSICKKIAFLHKYDAFLQEPFFMQHIHI